MNLTEKIEHEFRCFFLDMMRTSKENIFAHSEEIEAKKKLVVRLKKLLEELDAEREECLLLQENLLESSYQFLAMEKQLGSKEEPLKKWLCTVLQEEK